MILSVSPTPSLSKTGNPAARYSANLIGEETLLIKLFSRNKIPQLHLLNSSLTFIGSTENIFILCNNSLSAENNL